MSIRDGSGRPAISDSDEAGELSSVKVIVEQGSSLSRFLLHLVLPAPEVLSDYSDEGLRGVAAIQNGGRFLYYDTVEISSKEIQIMLTLHAGSREGVFLVTGDLTGKALPARIRARLTVDDVWYEADVVDGHVEFQDVVFPENVSEIRVTLYTPDDYPGSLPYLQ